MKTQTTRVLSLWFQDCEPKDWFIKDKCFDNKVQNNFGDLVKDASFGYLNNWR